MTSVHRTQRMKKMNVAIKTQTLAIFTAVVSAVALPQIVHLIGKTTGMGTSFGELLLPMQLPILLVGLLAGPYAGMIAGVLGPVCSILLSGMPDATVLPFMVIELGVYGLTAGLLRKKNIPIVAKVFAIQIAGRACKALAISIAGSVFGTTTLAVASVWNGVVNGLTGIALQLLVVPFIVAKVEKMSANE